MLLRTARSLLSPLRSPFSKSSCSQLSLSSRSPPLLLRFNQIKISPIPCSITQLNSYRTEDFEKWNSLYRRISKVKNPNLCAAAVLDQWDKQNPKSSNLALCRVVKELRKFRRFKEALEVYDWMRDKGDRFKFTSSDMAIKLDLISKVHGISTAEEYFAALPDQLKDKCTYGALLNAYGQSQMKEKAEGLLETMKAKGCIMNALPFNVMMTLYMNIGDHEKVNRIINEMKEKNVKLDLHSYNMWMINCDAMGKLEETEQVLERMISYRVHPNWTTYSTLASLFIKARNFEKAESYLKEVELRVTDKDPAPFQYLLGYYSHIGKKEEVYRIWELYKSKYKVITNIGYRAVLSSLVKLKDIDGAEAIYEEWVSKTSNYDPAICNILMGYYSWCGDFEKAKLLLDRLKEKGNKPKPATWEKLTEEYTRKKAKS